MADTLRALDTVRVDCAASFRSVIFMGSAEKKVFIRGENRPASEKPQKMTAAGVPVWQVKCWAQDWRDQDCYLLVSVPMYENPASVLGRGAEVRLMGLVFGVSNNGSGSYSLWCAADAIEPVSATTADA